MVLAIFPRMEAHRSSSGRQGIDTRRTSEEMLKQFTQQVWECFGSIKIHQSIEVHFPRISWLEPQNVFFCIDTCWCWPSFMNLGESNMDRPKNTGAHQAGRARPVFLRVGQQTVRVPNFRGRRGETVFRSVRMEGENHDAKFVEESDP